MYVPWLPVRIMSGSTATGYGSEEDIPGAMGTGAGRAAPVTGRGADGNPVSMDGDGTAAIGDNAGNLRAQIPGSTLATKNKGLLLTEKALCMGTK